MAERIEFAEAISEKLLLKKRWDKLSIPQQVLLKATYGLPLRSEEEVKAWAIFQGHASFDHLGYPTKIWDAPYSPREYSDIWAILGRRSGKSINFASFLVTYEACLGGHEEYIWEQAQYATCFLLAQDLKNSRNALNYIKAYLDESPLLRKEIDGDPTAETIKLKNRVQITVSPPNVKHVRGAAAPVVVMDEVGLWYTDSESANPDYEIERAVSYTQLQFPNRRLVGISTPYTKEGLLFKYWEAGTGGRNLPPSERTPFTNMLVMHAPTPAMQNPLFKREDFAKFQAKDPEGYERETLARFVDSISGFLNANSLRGCLNRDESGKGIKELAPVAGNYYIAAMDPAFRRDSFAFTIVHAEPGKGIIQDVVRRWRSQHGIPINPSIVLAEIAELLRQYRAPVVYSDQYQLESLQQLGLTLGMAIEGQDFTAKSKAKIFGSLQQLVNQGKLKLLDNPEQIDELVSLERKLTALGGVQIAAPAGKHDDLASVVALAAYKATWLLPAKVKSEPTIPTPFDKIMKQIKSRRVDDRVGAW